MQADEKTRNLAKRLRRRMSRPETPLWNALRANRLEGLHMRRQHPIGPYVLDFFCAAVKLAIEVDGGVHNIEERRERDAERSSWLGARGVRTLRVPAHVVENDIERVLTRIREAVEICRRRPEVGP
jgi:very-short-patch-repair endonuclease